MPYTPNSWLDGPAGGTPITAATLTHLESQYAQVKTYADTTFPAFTYMNGISVGVNSSMSQSAIQAVLTGAAAGTRVTFAPGTYTLAGPLTLFADNMVIDAPQATFVQTTWGQPGFDAIGRNGCIYDVGLVQWSGTRGAVGAGTYRGSQPYVSTAGIWINGDDNFVRRLKTSGMVCGVFLSSWAGTSAVDHIGVGNRLGTIECDNYNFAVLYVGQSNLIIDDLYGHDDLDDSVGTNPTHVLYCSATTSFRATGGQFKSLRSKNNLTGNAYQLKFHDQLRIDYMTAQNCTGLLNVIDSNDLTVGAYTSLGTLANVGQGSISFQRSVTNSQRPKFGPGFIQLAANLDERAINILADNGDFDRIMVESNHSGSINPATVGEVIIRGTGNRLRRPTFVSLGAGSIPAVWVGFSSETANNTVVTDLVVSGTLIGAKVDVSSTGVKVPYDPSLQSFTGASFFDVSGGNAVSTSAAAQVSLSTFGDNALAAMAVTSAPTIGTANSAAQMRLPVTKRDITVSSLVWWSASASGNYDIAIVDDVTNTVLWEKGSTTWPAAGAITETVTGVKLLAGRSYRVVFAADNATATFRGNQMPLSGIDLRLDGTTQSTNTTSTFPIPSAGSTLSAGSTGATRIPLIVVRGS